MRNYIIYLTVVISLFFSACGYKEGVVNATQKSYLYFTGNTKDVLVSIDNGAKFSVQQGQNNRYSIKPGKHLVEVYKGNIIVVKREIFVGDGIAKEIAVK